MSLWFRSRSPHRCPCILHLRNTGIKRQQNYTWFQTKFKTASQLWWFSVPSSAYSSISSWKKNNNNNQTNHQKGSGALNLGKKNKTKYMGHKMTALTLRFSSICVMACKIKVVQRGVNINQLKHQMTVGYHKNKASWKRVCVHSSWWIQKFVSWCGLFKNNNRKAIWWTTSAGTHPRGAPIIAIEI